MSDHTAESIRTAYGDILESHPDLKEYVAELEHQIKVDAGAKRILSETVVAANKVIYGFDKQLAWKGLTAAQIQASAEDYGRDMAAASDNDCDNCPAKQLCSILGITPKDHGSDVAETKVTEQPENMQLDPFTSCEFVGIKDGTMEVKVIKLGKGSPEGIKLGDTLKFPLM